MSISIHNGSVDACVSLRRHSSWRHVLTIVAISAACVTIRGYCLSAAWAAAPGVAQGSSAELVAGKQHFEAGRYEEAVAAFDSAIAAAPAAEAHYWRGEALRRSWRLGPAAEDFDRAIKLDPRHARAYLGRGLVREYKGYSDLAAGDYDTALQLDPQLVLAYVYRGGIRWKLGRVADARADLNRAVELCGQMLRDRPNDPQTYRARALAWRTLERYDRAIEDHGQMIRLAPGSVEALVERGRTYAQRHSKNVAMGDLGEQMNDKIASVADFDRAIELAAAAIGKRPSDVQAYRLRTEAYEARAFAWKDPEDFRLAIADCDAVVRLAGECPTIYFRRGHIHAGASHYSGEPAASATHFRQADEDLGRVVRLDPTYAAAWHERGLLYVRAALRDEKPDLAARGVADLTETLRLVPGGALIYCARGSAHGLAGDYQRAMDDFNQAVRLCPEMADAYALRGGANLALGNKEAAHADLARAQELRMRAR